MAKKIETITVERDFVKFYCDKCGKFYAESEVEDDGYCEADERIGFWIALNGKKI